MPTEEKLYTEADLVSFGKFLLSPEREKKIYDFEISGNLIADDKENTMAHHIFRSVTHAAVCNWKREQGYPTESDADPKDDILEHLELKRETPWLLTKSIDH